MNKEGKYYLILFISILLLVFALIKVSIKSSSDRKQYIKYHQTNEKNRAEILNAERQSWQMMGRLIDFSRLERRNQVSSNSKSNHRLWLIVDELGCEICREREARFLKEISSVLGPSAVGMIIKSRTDRYIRNFIRTNQVEYEVLSCLDETFFKANRISESPILMLLDNMNRVVACHFPLTDWTEYSEPFHQYCFAYLGDSK